jgi:hypothetical protein
MPKTHAGDPPIHSTSSAGRRATHRPGLVLVMIWLIATLVNVTKAIHMDDPTYLIIAGHILDDPLHPMSATFALSGVTRSGSFITQPLLIPYAYAGIMALFGESELALHLFLSVFSGLAIVCFYILGRRLCPQNALTLSVAFGLGPAFLPAQNLMTDVPVVALWLAFFCLLTRPGGKGPRYAAAASVAGVACLVKYSSLALLPLLFVPIALRREWRQAWSVLIPIALLVAWSLFNLFDYGGIHMVARRSNMGEFSTLSGRLEAWILCLGAVAPFSVVSVPLFLRRRRLAIPVSAAVAVATWASWESLACGSSGEALLKAAFLANGVLVAIVTVISLERARAERREDVALLASWLIAGAAFTILFAPFMAVRHVLLVIPAILLTLGRGVQDEQARRWQGVGCLLTVVLGLALAAADWQYANVYRTQARAMRDRLGPEARLWYLGNWGWRWYAEAEGMAPYLMEQTELEEGDFVVVAVGPSGPDHVARRHRERVTLVDEIEVAGSSLPRIMQPFPRGGYYSVKDGVPWTFSREPIDRFRVLAVGKTADPSSHGESGSSSPSEWQP